MRERWLVVSPHCDDAVLSLGATIAEHVRSGGEVNVVTVLAGDPASKAAAGTWDLCAGFRSEGDATRQRRVEDRAACRAIGATPIHLAGSDHQYRSGNHIDGASLTVLQTLGAHHDVIFIPGHPLMHPDHRWVSDLVRRELGSHRDLRLYGEEPYIFWTGRPPVPDGDAAVDAGVTWHRSPNSTPDRVRKLLAVTRYRSQLDLLGRARQPDATLPRLRFLMKLWRAGARGEWVSDPLPGRSAGS